MFLFIILSKRGWEMSQPKKRLTLQQALYVGAFKPMEDTGIFLIREEERVDIYFQCKDRRNLLKYQMSYPAVWVDRPTAPEDAREEVRV